MIDIHDVWIIHDALIKEFGGSKGVRDYDLLTSALNRPFAGTGNIEFYPAVHQ